MADPGLVAGEYINQDDFSFPNVYHILGIILLNIVTKFPLAVDELNDLLNDYFIS